VDVEHLFDDVWNTLEELKHLPDVLAGFVRATGAPLYL
jgi:hypothetical protein